MGRTVRYQVLVRVQGELDPAFWSGSFTNMAVAVEPDGTTLLRGTLPDQAAVHGLLTTIGDLGLSLLAVETLAEPGPETETPKTKTGGAR
jgi:hypothetical protein